MICGLILAGCIAATAIGLRYDTTSKTIAGAINVHLIPHSHDDVGWLKTPEQCFVGSRVIGIDPDGLNLPSVYYADAGVNIILTTVVDSLRNNPDRTFTVVEQFFFQRWYEIQDAAVQAAVQSLVHSGQLVFANGGLVMHDEAGPSYIDMVDQTTAGTRWITSVFGEAAAPRVTSQLDPFGHSATQVAFLSAPNAGYIATFHARMDYEEVAVRYATQRMDFAWAPSTSLGNTAVTMGSLGWNGYSNPDNLCFDVSIECDIFALTSLPYNQPINDDPFPDSTDNNVDAFVSYTVNLAQSLASSAYPKDPDGTAHLPVMMGTDFNFRDAAKNYGSIDKLIHYVNLNTSIHGVNLLYSTQAMYAESRLGMQTPLTMKTSDAFPYADTPHSVWAGYFTSRAALKGYVRETSTLFQMAKQLQAWVSPPDNTGVSNPLWLLETAMGVLQHHDAVAGTAKQVVAFDYARRIQQSRDATRAAQSAWLNDVLGVGGSNALSWVACDLANATICALTEATTSNPNSPIALMFYNADSHVKVNTAAAVRIPVPQNSNGPQTWAVFAADGVTPVPAQLIPASPVDDSLRTTYYGMPAASMAWLCFFVPGENGAGAPPVGFTTVFIVPAKSAEQAPQTYNSEVHHVSPQHLATGGGVLTNGILSLSFDATGLLNGYTSTNSTDSIASIPLQQSLIYYNASTGDATDSQASGAYIFRPNSSSTSPVLLPGHIANITFLRGPIVNEAWQKLSPWAWQVFRIWQNASNSFDVEATVGPLPVPALFGPGMELISQVMVPGWQTNSTFYTDSNGREWQQRIRNSRPDYPLNITEPIAQNMYPVNTALRLVDTQSGAALTILTDRTVAGGSLADGECELMLHRRLVADDSRGVMEALNEPGVNLDGLIIRTKHTYLITPAGPVTPRAYRAALQQALLPLTWVGSPLPPKMTPQTWVPAAKRTTGSLITQALPPNVYLLTTHAWNATAVLVRLAHLFEAGEDATYSQNATVQLSSLFDSSAFSVTDVVEMTLTASQPLAHVRPVTYKVSGVSSPLLREYTSGLSDDGDHDDPLMEAVLASASRATTAASVAADRLVSQLPTIRRKPANAGVGAATHAKLQSVADESQWKDDFTAAPVQSITLPYIPAPPTGPNWEVTLSPMQIRTFLLTVARQ